MSLLLNNNVINKISYNNNVGYTIVGSPTINNGIISGFSDSDYVSISNKLDFTNNNECIIKFTTPSAWDKGSNQYLFTSNLFFYFIANGSLRFGYKGTNSTWPDYNIQSTLDVSKQYWIKFSNTSNTLNVYFSEDGTTYSLKQTKDISNIDNSYKNDIRFGILSGAPFTGSIDLNETYIKINGITWFNGKEQASIDVDYLALNNNIVWIKNPFNKPTDWSDIRNDCPNNSIALYVGELGSNYIIKDGKLTWANPNLYLQSSGTQYIDADVYGSGSTTFNIKYTSVGNSGVILGSRTSSNSNDRLMLLHSDSNRFDYNGKYRLVSSFSDALFETSISEGQYIVKAISLTNGAINSGSIEIKTFTTPTTIKLYAGDNNGTILDYWSGKIYFCKIYDGNGSLVRHFVPVPENLVIGNFTCPSNGMFDIVNQQFYGNEGTGDFTFGKDSISNDYDNLGFTATCTGGYKVFIDGVQYGSTYASGTQCSITWSTSGITTGDDITTPSTLKAHKIWITPATEGAEITAFKCARVASSGKELQGVLWSHFNLSNRIVAGHQTFSGGAFYNTRYHNNMIKAVTAKNNLLKITYFNQFVGENLSLEYVPIFESNLSNDLWIAGTAGGCKKITVKNYVCDNRRFDYSFCSCSELENVILKNCTISPSNLTAAFNDCFKLKKVPETIDYSNATNMTSYLYRNNSLEDTVLDVSAATGLTKIGCFSTSQYFMSGFKGLRVSSSAPFTGTSPQINVSYTGMDRSALVQLFNDLPYNVGYTTVGTPTISSGGVVSNFSTSDYLTLPTIDLSHPFEIMFKIKTPVSWGTAYDVILGANSTIRYTFQKTGANRCFSYYVPNEDGTSRTQHDGKTGLLENTIYYIRTRFTGTKLIIDRSTDKETWTEEYSENRTVGFFSIDYAIGRSARAAQQVWTGEVDLSETYIKVKDVYVFRGQPAMTKILSCVGASGNQNNLTIVGSPAISSGVVSGFSSSDYLTLPYLPSVSNLEMQITFRTPSSFASSYETIFLLRNYFSLEEGTVPGGGVHALATYDWGSSSYKNVIPASDFAVNTDYKVKVISTNGVFSFSYSKNGGDFITTLTLDRSSGEQTHLISLGNAVNNINRPFTGSIDLNSTYIKVNNELWFGREQYLLPEDKSIAEDKGWALTLTA